MTILEAIKQAALKLKKTSDSPDLDSEVLLAHVLSEGRAFLFANPDKKLTKSQENLYKKLIRKRNKHWPVAYLTGKKRVLRTKVSGHARRINPPPRFRTAS